MKKRRFAQADNQLEKCIIEVTQQLKQTIERYFNSNEGSVDWQEKMI